jgi:hypothetical protein
LLFGVFCLRSAGSVANWPHSGVSLANRAPPTGHTGHYQRGTQGATNGAHRASPTGHTGRCPQGEAGQATGVYISRSSSLYSSYRTSSASTIQYITTVTSVVCNQFKIGKVTDVEEVHINPLKIGPAIGYWDGNYSGNRLEIGLTIGYWDSNYTFHDCRFSSLTSHSQLLTPYSPSSHPQIEFTIELLPL